ncbi:MAG: hypothetical protein AB1705_22320, partial [Verrucomicrobiota bacterium]
MKRLLLLCALFLLPAHDSFSQLSSTQDPFRSQVGNTVRNLRVTRFSPDRTEALLTMEYAYDGFGGPTALIVPVIEKKGQPNVASWFGADPVTVGKGRGIVSVPVRYFNDEPGVPPEFTSDRIRILIMNNNRRNMITSVPVLKEITWGTPDAKPAAATPGTREGRGAKADDAAKREA